MSLFLILGPLLGEAVASEGPKRKVLCSRSAPGVRTVRKTLKGSLAQCIERSVGYAGYVGYESRAWVDRHTDVERHYCRIHT